MSLNQPADPSVLPVPPDPVRRVPNPGSDEALSMGCECAVLDNCHGRFAPVPPDGWFITMGCPVHDPRPRPGKAGGEAA